MPQMITTRKTTNQTAHRAQQDGTWMGADLFTSTVCGLTIRSGEWSEVDTSGRGWSALVGHGPAFLLQPCMRCEAAVRKLRDADHAEALAVPMPADRIPEVMSGWCEYCTRYSRPCGRHEDVYTTVPTGRTACGCDAQSDSCPRCSAA